MAIGVHGPNVVFEFIQEVRRYYREDWPAWMEVSVYLREGGMEQGEILNLVCDEHPNDCACWDCILELQAEIIRSRAIAAVERFEPPELTKAAG
jgi:hypothetical protein